MFPTPNPITDGRLLTIATSFCAHMPRNFAATHFSSTSRAVSRYHVDTARIPTFGAPSVDASGFSPTKFIVERIIIVVKKNYIYLEVKRIRRPQDQALCIGSGVFPAVTFSSHFSCYLSLLGSSWKVSPGQSLRVGAASPA